MIEQAVNISNASNLFDQLRANQNARGLLVYSTYDLQSIQGQNKQGEQTIVKYRIPYFTLTIEQRNLIFRNSAYIFGIVNGFMQKISSLDWNIVTDKSIEDELVIELKEWYQLASEFKQSTTIEYQVASAMYATKLKKELPDLLPDLSNFNSALLRLSKRIKKVSNEKLLEIKDWLIQPNLKETFNNFTKKFVYDLLIHGNAAIYKESGYDNLLENFYLLPGGSVYPSADFSVFDVKDMYFQYILGEQPKIYFNDEISFCRYVPSSSLEYGNVPLEALVNMILCEIYFDDRMAKTADGSKPAEKLVIMGTTNPFGNISQEFDIPSDPEEQKRLEIALSEYQKEAIKVISGFGNNLQVVDVSRADTLGIQLQYQTEVKKKIALVYGLSNIEINESDSGGASGRATSQSLETIDMNKSVIPLVNIFKEFINTDILPYRYGHGFRLDFELSKNIMEETQIDNINVANKTSAVNEIRIKRGEEPFADKKYDLPLENVESISNESNTSLD